MALIKCRNCDHMISDKAVKCPKCGTPVHVEKDVKPEKNEVPVIADAESSPTIEEPIVDMPAVDNTPRPEAVTRTYTNEPEKEQSDKKNNSLLIGVFVGLFVLLGIIWLTIQNEGTTTATPDPNIDNTEESAVSQEDEAKKELEEFINFKTSDLSSFMLHGKVKEVTYYTVGEKAEKFEFDEHGNLLRGENYANGDTWDFKISHENNNLLLSLDWSHDITFIRYKVDYDKLLVRDVGDAEFKDSCIYKAHNSYNWPEKEIHYIWEKGEDPVIHNLSVKFEDIDEYGNWTKRVNLNGKVLTEREIKYYPLKHSQQPNNNLEEIKNLQTLDLAAFMLHGKVKRLICHANKGTNKFEFDNHGNLISGEYNNGEKTYHYEISHNDNILILGISWGEESEYTFEEYEVNNEKLVRWQYFDYDVDSCAYSEYNSNNWPEKETFYAFEMDVPLPKVSEFLYKYNDIDDYGNWTKKANENGEIIERREIEYYPIGE